MKQGQVVIHQLIPMLHARDAVGNHTLALRDALRDNGVVSDIFVEHFDPNTKHETHLYTDLDVEEMVCNLYVYQVATASKMSRWLMERSEPFVINFHNITPPEYFEPWNREIAQIQRNANAELKLLALRSLAAISVSRFNELQLEEIGFANTKVLPPLILSSSSRKPSPRQGEIPLLKWLSIGRIAPNKRLENAISALYFYNSLYKRSARLVIVGRCALPNYFRSLKVFARDLGIAHMVDFVGTVEDEALGSYYSESDLLLVTSNHEGYCFPLVEAMNYELLILARNAGAIGEVLGNSDLLVNTDSPIEFARKVYKLEQVSERDRAIARYGDQLESLGLKKASEGYVELLTTLVTKNKAAAGNLTATNKAGSKHANAI
jgi:glycosyltransferase involved in cell wall biosynthesis